MKKTRSIFIKIGILMLSLVLLLEMAVLFFIYEIIYDANFSSYEKQLRKATFAAVSDLHDFNLEKDSDLLNKVLYLDDLCEWFDITYMYVLKLDVKANTEKYIVLGFGEDASEEAKKSRYPGVVVEGMINKEEIEAYDGNSNGVFLNEKTQFGNTLVCYVPCTGYNSTDTNEFIYYDEPYIVGSEISIGLVNQGFQSRFNTVAITMITVSLLLLLLFFFILYFKIAKPIKAISSRMNSFITDRKKGTSKLPVKGSDELALMAESFNTMTDEIDSYINNIDILNREKHTQETELNIARNIQMGLLRPKHFVSCKTVIDAYMLPAKDVGGDLYDYRELDDGRIFVAVADVSGKGISASLFMARAITLLNQLTLNETSPARILSAFNDTLAEYNPGGLFITTFLAIWDPSANELTYSNAGHNYPYILSDKLIRLDGAHGVAVGLFEGVSYEDTTEKLGEGDTLFLYTDGVNEAQNAEKGFYSTERLESKLSGISDSDKPETLKEILRDLNGFTQGAEQSDDITILTLHIKQKPQSKVFNFVSDLNNLNEIKAAVFSLDISSDLKKKIFLAAEEIFVNICSYAYETPGNVKLKVERKNDGISLTFTDSGIKFNPTEDLQNIDEYDHENTIGGLGRFITFSVADSYNYEYRDGKNILYLYFSEDAD